MFHKTGLKIEHHNIRGVRTKITELMEHINSEKPDIISLNETFLKPKMKTPVVPGYTWTRNDRITGKQGGVAFLIKDSITFDISENTTVKTKTPHETLTIELFSPKNASLYISTIYCPGGAPSPAFFAALCKNKTNHIICGDFNAKHTALGDATDSLSGRQLFKIISDNDLLLTNDEIPTYFHEATLKTSILDHILITRTLKNYFNGFHVDDEDLGSDHNIIVAWFGLKTLSTEKTTKTIKLYHKINWEETNEKLLEKFNNKDNSTTTDPLQKIEEQVNSLTHYIQNIQNSIPVKKIQNDNTALPPEIRALIKEKRHTRNRWKKTRDPQLKQKYNQLKKTVTFKIKMEKQKNWAKFCNDMELDGQKQAWKKIKTVVNKKQSSFKYPILKYKNPSGVISKAKTTEEKLTAFYENFKPTFEDNLDPEDFNAKHKETIDDYVSQNEEKLKPDRDPAENANCVIPPKEIIQLIGKLSTKKAAGPDKITNKLIKLLSASLSQILSKIFTLSLKHGYIPKAWKEANVLLIGKPDKTKTDPANYRPISLLSCLGKLMEKAITIKLLAWAELNNKINLEQSGFRNKRSTQDQLFRLTQQIIQGKNKKQKTSSLFLDVEKAFDRVWHNGLRYKLMHLDTPPQLLRWISNFLSDRKMKITINGKASKPMRANYGVPQGSPLSPILFILFVADCPTQQMTHCTSTQFADDLSISTTSKKLQRNVRYLQNALNTLTTWCNMWRIKISHTKTKLLHFTKSKSAQKTTVSIKDTKITTCNEAKFLGIKYDKMLSFKKHFQEQKNKAVQRLHKLKWIASAVYGPSDESMLRLYKCYIRSLFEYGSASTTIASKNTYRSWELIQRRFAKTILHFPHVSSAAINRHCNLSSVQNRNLQLARKWYNKTQEHSDRLSDFTNSIIKTNPKTDKYKTPHDFCKTN